MAPAAARGRLGCSGGDAALRWAYDKTMFKWPTNRREFARAAAVWGVFLFIVYFGREALHHRNEAAGRAFLDILVFIAACGAAAFVSHVWEREG